MMFGMQAVSHSEPANFSARGVQPAPRVEDSAHSFSQKIAQTLKLISEKVSVQRRVVRAGDHVYQAGEQFQNLYIINSGFYKVSTVSPDGREQVVALKFRGDWLGVDGMAQGKYNSDAVAMDTGEVWVVRYEAFVEACLAERNLLTALHEAMSRELAHERDSLMSVCTLSGDARVADFLRSWADALAKRGMRTDQITLRMTRAEIGNYLGLTLETVSRALSRLAKVQLIGFDGKGRRDISIPDVAALTAFVQSSLAPHSTLQ
jgi:CRP/FNR family transcriptional regulator, anaerobic regulatory protein